MATDEKKAMMDPSTQSSAYMAMAPVWEKVGTVLDGTDAMRAAGQLYLPMHENESPEAYEDRRSCATLLNMTSLTLDSWVGRPFSDPCSIAEELSDDVKGWLDNADLQGNNIHVFARGVFKDGLAKAFTHVLVDFPEVEGPLDRPRTLADDFASGARPFVSHVAPENLIFAEAQFVDGKEVLTHIRMVEQEMVRVGFAEMMIDRIRVFDRVIPGLTSMPSGMQLSDDPELASLELFGPDGAGGVFVSVWRRNPDAKRDEDEWILEQPPTRIGIAEIPLVTFYADRQGLMRGKSPLEDLVDLNIRWWQSNSDQINVLTVSRFPLLSATGVDLEDDILEIGPKRLLSATSEKAVFKYVEHTGAAIEAGRQDLMDLEEQMGHYGADFLKRRPGNMTATARALDSAESTSPLQDAALRFNDALTQIVSLMLMWTGQELELDGPPVTVATDFGPETFVEGDVSTLTAARTGRDLSRRKYLEELRRRGSLAEEFDFEENDQELEDEVLSAPAPLAEAGPTDDDDIDPLAEE